MNTTQKGSSESDSGTLTDQKDLEPTCSTRRSLDEKRRLRKRHSLCRRCLKRTAWSSKTHFGLKLRPGDDGDLYLNPRARLPLPFGAEPVGQLQYVFSKNRHLVAVLHVSDYHVEIPYAKAKFSKYARKTPFDPANPVDVPHFPATWPGFLDQTTLDTLDSFKLVPSESQVEVAAKRRKREHAGRTTTFYVNPFLTDQRRVTVQLDLTRKFEVDGVHWLPVLSHEPADVPQKLFSCRAGGRGEMCVPAQAVFFGLVAAPFPFPTAPPVDVWSDVYRAASKGAPQAYLDLFERLSPKQGVWVDYSSTGGQAAEVSSLHCLLQKALTMPVVKSPPASCLYVRYLYRGHGTSKLIIYGDYSSNLVMLYDSVTLERVHTFQRKVRASRASLLDRLRLESQKDIGFKAVLRQWPKRAAEKDVQWSARARLPQSSCDALETLYTNKASFGICRLELDGSIDEYAVSFNYKANRVRCTRLPKVAEVLEAAEVLELKRLELPLRARRKLHFQLVTLPTELKGLSYNELGTKDSETLFQEMVDPRLNQIRLPAELKHVYAVFGEGKSPQFVEVDTTDAKQCAAVRPFVHSFLAGMQRCALPDGRGEDLVLAHLRFGQVHVCCNELRTRQFLAYAHCLLRDVREKWGECSATDLNLATCFFGPWPRDVERVALKPFGLEETKQAARLTGGAGLCVTRCSAANCGTFVEGDTPIDGAVLVGIAALGKSQWPSAEFRACTAKVRRPFHSGWGGAALPEVYKICTSAAFLPVLTISFARV